MSSPTEHPRKLRDGWYEGTAFEDEVEHVVRDRWRVSYEDFRGGERERYFGTEAASLAFIAKLAERGADYEAEGAPLEYWVHKAANQKIDPVNIRKRPPPVPTRGKGRAVK